MDSSENPPQKGFIARSEASARTYAAVSGLLHRMQLSGLLERHNASVIMSLFSFTNGCIAIALMTTVALISGEDFIFPSLGPTAFLFFYSPLEPSASPRNAIFGHLIGVIAGWGSLAMFGLLHVGPAISVGVSEPRIGAAALSLGLTAGLMVLLKTPHPPAGATTLIISLGILRTIEQMAFLMAAVMLLTLQAIAINRLAGLPYPLWSARKDSGDASSGA